MDRMHLTKVTPLRTAHRGMTFAVVGVLAVVVVAVVGAAALSLGQGPAQVPVGGGIVAPAETTVPPSAPPSDVPGLAPLPVTVTGTEACSDVDQGNETTVAGVRQIRGIEKRCVERMSDPRLNGASTRAYSVDVAPDSSERWWGTAQLTNDGGAWRGTWTGTFETGASVVDIVGFWTGIGGYEGLQYRLSAKISAYSIDVTGTLEAVGPVEVTATESCRDAGSVSRGPAIDGYAATYRGGILDCSDVASDPRVGGTSRVTVDIDQRADGSADLRTTWVITNDAGTWEGTGVGTVDIGYTTHRVAFELEGTGDYAGFRYAGSLVSEDGRESTITGLIEPID